MWNVQENPLDRTILPTREVAAYAERRRALLQPDAPGSAQGGSSRH